MDAGRPLLYTGPASPRGGIGRRDGFKIRFFQRSVGSSPTEGTIRQNYDPHEGLVRIYMFGFGKWRTIATALQKLIADKEDTKQVFIILQAMGRRSGIRSYKRFLKNANAEKILTPTNRWFHI